MIKNVEMLFEFKNYIAGPPQTADEMHKQACENDKVTVDAWREKWISHYKINHERFGSFKERGLGKLFGINKHKPCLIVGSGPSLANNIEELKKAKDAGIMVLSCLHNFQYMVDNDVHVDYYVSLDAGSVVIEEISEGGKKTHQDYVESTKDKKLIAYVGSDPKLFENWKGEVYLFNASGPDSFYLDETSKVEPFYTMVSTGGNVLGACLYIAKAIFGSVTIGFCGADFCFGYKRNFHPWPSKYDGNLGQAMRAIDIWGNGVLTWPSYYNFKIWFDWVTVNVPGVYINCTEGGLFGSYPDGNIMSVRQMVLKDFLFMHTMNDLIRAQCEIPEVDHKTILF